MVAALVFSLRLALLDMKTIMGCATPSAHPATGGLALFAGACVGIAMQTMVLSAPEDLTFMAKAAAALSLPHRVAETAQRDTMMMVALATGVCTHMPSLPMAVVLVQYRSVLLV